MKNKNCLLVLVVTVIIDVFGTNVDGEYRARLEDDPSSFPGHMEPIGSKQPKTKIEVLTEYPSPKDYFLNYVRPSRPFMIKGGAKYQGAWKLWNDEYMMSFKESETEKVQVEPNKKEVRDAIGFEVPFKEFLQRYGTEKIYMVNRVPSFLQKDVMMPPPLRCNNTRDLMLDHVTWMSSGGTKSVLHQDDLDNINCLFRGEKYLLFINPVKYGSKVPIDKPEGGYSTVDVDKVNFTKYPSMREIEFIECQMEEGDCLFIPRGWYHQVNSKANQNKQNIAVNIWFRHDPKHLPKDCDLDEEEASIDHFHFPGLESVLEEKEEGDEEEDSEDEKEDGENYSLLDIFKWSLSQTKYRRASFKTFVSLLIRVPALVTKQDISTVVPDKNFLEVAKMLFNTLNVDEGKYIDEEDFTEIMSSPEKSKEVDITLSAQVRNLQMIAASLLHTQTRTSLVDEHESKKEEL